MYTMNWFEKLMGFTEVSPEQVRSNIILNGNELTSKVNGKTYHHGALQIDSVANLRALATKIAKPTTKRIGLKEVIGDVQLFHVSPENENALFQAASQFNLLEMVSPSVTPESGVGQYEFDKTQGPACAIACGAGTIYRNYFVELDGQIGQTAQRQIDCLSLLAEYFNNAERLLWKNQNGYAFANAFGLDHIHSEINKLDHVAYEALKGKLRVGVQWDTQVTIASKNMNVSQIYCSALPVGYSHVPQHKWETFARLILEATYEATILSGIINHARYGSDKVYLTLVGGGVFGNEPDWLIDTITNVLQRYIDCGLDISFISYGQSNAIVQQIIKQINPN